MGKASTTAYERLISSLRTFDKRVLEISGYLVKCSQVATDAMENDDPSTALKKKVEAIVSQMLVVSEMAEKMKVSMEKTHGYLLQLERDENSEE